MDIVFGSGNRRQKVSLATGHAMRYYERSHPIDYVKMKGTIMDRIRNKPELSKP